MRITRLVWFVMSIIIGVLLGMYLGWRFIPVPYIDMTLDSLRSDYKTDYVLMVAEAYQQDGDTNMVDERLKALGAGTPLRSAQEAVIKGRELDYNYNDIDLLVILVEVLQAAPITPTQTVEMTP